MNRERALVVALTVAAMVALVVVVGSGGDSEGGEPVSAGGIEVSFPYSPEKEELLAPLISEFNASGAEVDGEAVVVDGEPLASGEAVRKIASAELEPVAWSPASSLWGRLLNFKAGEPLTAPDAESLVRTPLVIAAWEPMARALGWPDRPVGFGDIADLARSPDGWGAYGHPEFGDFKLVHTNPDFSTSGLSAVVAEYYSATGKSEGLVPSDIDGPARATVQDTERSIVHYGDTTLFVSDQMCALGPSYASAAVMEEVTLIDFNRECEDQPKLVAIYPDEGTFFSDSPFYVLDGDWVSDGERAGAKAIERFLSERITPELAAESGFRPADPAVGPLDPISTANGADPAQPERTLSAPSPRVLATIRRAWRADRKPANVMLAVDVSGSMAGEQRLERAKVGLLSFLDEISPKDRVGLLAFDDQVEQLVPIGAVARNEDTLRRTIRGLRPGGGTAFRDATAQAFERVRAVAARGGDRINSVIVLSDGEDTDSSRSLRSVLDELSTQGDSATQVRVFTIAYSPTAQGAAEALRAIAEASGGQTYEGGTGNISRVYRSISSFF